MKNLRYLFATSALLAVVACSSSDDNVYYPPVVQQDPVIGTWRLTAKSVSANPTDALNVPLSECESKKTMMFADEQVLIRTTYSGANCATADETELVWAKGFGNGYLYSDADDIDDTLQHEYSNNNTELTTVAFDGANYTTKRFVKVN